MVLTEAPSYNSSRVQRAFRINNIEQARLNGRLQLIEKEKLHAIRVTNQDIRLISLTLDYIQACSGTSQETAVAPSSPEPSSEDYPEDDPCFLYGERIVSRRARRSTTRPQSAASTRRPPSEHGDEGRPPRARRIRPQSSPPIKSRQNLSNDAQGTFVTQLDSWPSSPTESCSEMSSITRKLLQAQKGEEERKSVFASGNRNRLERSQSAMSRVLRTEATLATLPPSGHEKRIDTPDSHRSSFSSLRGVGVSELLNKSDVHVMSANEWKKHLQHKNGSTPVRYSKQRKDIMSHKMEIDGRRRLQTQVKLNNFCSKHPLPRSTIFR